MKKENENNNIENVENLAQLENKIVNQEQMDNNINFNNIESNTNQEELDKELAQENEQEMYEQENNQENINYENYQNENDMNNIDMNMEGEEIVISDEDDPMTKAIKMKMRENREKVRRAKAAKAAQEKSDMKLSDLIGSITINDCGLNIVNIWDVTYYAFHDQLKRMGWRDQFNINQKAALAGAKINKSQLKHWMRSIASDK